MLAELFDRIVKLSREAQSIQVVHVEGVDGRRLVRTGATKDAEWVNCEPPRAAHAVQSLQDFCTMAKDTKLAPKPQVWCDTLTPGESSKLHLVLDHEKRREIVTMALPYSTRMAKLMAMGTGSAMSGPDLIRFIRFDLQGVGADDLILALRTLDWQRIQGGSTKTGHGRESLGASVEAQVAQAEKIPENFTAVVPVWQALGTANITATVVCGVYIDVTQQRLLVRPLADEVEKALQLAAGQVHALIAKLVDPVPVITGRPLFVSG